MYPCYPKQATRVWGSEITTVTFMSYTFEAASFASQASYQHLAVSSSPQANPLRCLQASTLLKLPSSQHKLKIEGLWEDMGGISMKFIEKKLTTWALLPIAACFFVFFSQDLPTFFAMRRSPAWCHHSSDHHVWLPWSCSSVP